MEKLAMLVVVVLLVFNSGAQATVSIDWVSVGNAGNSNDWTGSGGVSDVYQISKYEVTAGQYTEFLNAVAATDTYGVYKTEMVGDSWSCQITRNGVSGSYTYDFSGRPSGTEADWSNRPVTDVSWYDTLRFSNWLHNGQPTGPQTDATTEDGAYDMSLGSNVVRKAGAQVWLPSEDEWYKAAYHKNDGVTGNYFDYPTSSDSVPGNDLVEPTDPGNSATFYDGVWPDIAGFTIGSPYYRTEVGAHENSDSPYGTFDQGGNVYEWNETLIENPEGFGRGVRGGVYGFTVDALSSSFRLSINPDDLGGIYGFRVASAPEPCNYVLTGDLDNNCKVNLADLAMMVANWLINCNADPSDPACVPK